MPLYIAPGYIMTLYIHVYIPPSNLGSSGEMVRGGPQVPHLVEIRIDQLLVEKQIRIWSYQK